MARFNTQPITGSVTAGGTLAALTQNAFIQLTGTAPYTVTLPSPVLFPGFNQTFYNATSGVITLTTPANVFTGAGGSGTANVTVPATSTINLVSDGVNYVVVGEDGTSLTATTGAFSGNVTINGAGATLSVTPQTVTINPGGSSTIDNVAVGATTRSTGAFTTVTANAAVTFTANTASSTTGTGSLVVTGGIGVSGNINSGGTVAAVALSGPLTGTIQTAAQPNITSVGNLTATGLTVDTDTLVVDATNNRVGISTASPTAKLHITGANKIGGILVESSSTSAGSPSIEVIGKRSDGNSSSAFAGKILLGANRTDAAVATNKRLGAVAFGGNHTDGLLTNLLYTASISGIAEGTFADANTMPTGLVFFTGAVGTTSESTTVAMGTERMRINNAGNVGIGTVLPTSRLHVSYAGAVNTNTFNVSTTSNTTTPTTLLGANLVLDDAGTTYTKSATSISGAGILFEGANSLNSHGSIQFLSAPDTNTGSASPLERMRIDSAGNVGIGASTPAYKLDVAGSIGADNLRITAVNSSVAVTATSVFVYDTRKDSDGGAWRKRTQNTSWYNETLNTATRGSRREFPAVAVIVAISGTTGITIYDGDDPLMPMWIKYTYLSWDGPIRGISAVNGIIAGAIGTSLNYSGNGLVLLDFIKDRQSRNYISGYSNLKNGFVHELLSTTRLNTTYLTIGTDTREYTLGNYNATDVATTVLPNAPIDSATGLPIPTIAVTTYSGIYVIHNNGIVNSINATDAVEYNYWRSVEFTKDYKLIINGTYAGVANNIVHVCDIPYTNFSGAVVNQRITALNSRYYHSDSSIPNLKPMELARTASMDINTFAIGGASNTGFNIIAESPDTASGINSSAMIVYVAPTYNTGWMVGNIKGAWLCDTTVQTLTGSGNVAAWTVPSNWTKQPSISISYSSPTLSITGNGTSSNVYFFLPITVVANTTYTFTITFGTFNSSGFVINTAQYTVGSALVNITGSAGTYTYTFNSGSATTVYLQSYQVSTSPTTITNFDMRLADPDRSVNNQGLQVFGTITKSAIDTGNDLVAYSGWSNSNYVEQPYTSLLDYGTGDFYYTFWIKTDASAAYSSNTYVFERSSVSDVSSRRVEVRASSPSNLQVYSANTTVNDTVPITAGEWSKFDWVRRSGTMFIYVNGLFVSSITLASTVSDTSATLVIGNRAYFSPRNSGLSTTTKLALFKTSATAPSDVQILKMYNDERELFLPGSKACLYGSSGVITAVAFDNATNLLHVGTSSGRSVFNGLRQVDNTATAVATSISAANGLVAEQ